MAHQNQNPEKTPHFSGKQNKTPAPTTRSRKDFGTADGAYGTNQYSGPASVAPGKTVTSPLADDLRRSSDDGESVLAKVIQGGVKKDDGFQLRGESSKQLPTTFGHRNANDGGAPMGTVPNACGGSADVKSPTRKP